MSPHDSGQALEKVLKDMGSVVVAYSGGVDSAIVAWAGRRVLGDRCLPVIADSASLPRSELTLALANAQAMGFPVRVIQTHEQENPEYLKNEPNRCFFCKSELFSRLDYLARAEGYSSVACGDNADDREDDRPGMKAARELAVRSPLRDAGLGKEAIRSLARSHGLPVWDKPASACLASRIPHGTFITLEALKRVERAEDMLRAEGFRQIRVRHRGPLALIQVGPDETPRFSEALLRDRVSRGIRDLGFEEVEIDPAGYARA